MLMLNTALKSAEQPALEQRGDVMNPWHDFVSLFVPTADNRNAMFVACDREARIALSSVGVNCCARLHGFLNEVQHAFGRNILDAFQSDAPDGATAFLRGNHDDGLFLDIATPLAFFRATHVGFIDFNLAGKLCIETHGAPSPRVPLAPRSARKRNRSASTSAGCSRGTVRQYETTRPFHRTCVDNRHPGSG
jgi:hypothetical protein